MNLKLCDLTAKKITNKELNGLKYFYDDFFTLHKQKVSIPGYFLILFVSFELFFSGITLQ